MMLCIFLTIRARAPNQALSMYLLTYCVEKANTLFFKGTARSFVAKFTGKEKTLFNDRYRELNLV